MKKKKFEYIFSSGNGVKIGSVNPENFDGSKSKASILERLFVLRSGRKAFSHDPLQTVESVVVRK